MLVATCRIQLSLNGVSSLKEKRRILKSVIGRLTNQFNVSIAEIEHQDVWQTAVLGLAAVGSEGAQLQRVMESVLAWFETNRPDLYIVHFNIEFR